MSKLQNSANIIKVSGDSSSVGHEEARIIRIVQRGEKLRDLIGEIKALTFANGEHAIVKLAAGEYLSENGLLILSQPARAIVSGGERGIDFLRGQLIRLYLHSHPYSLPATGPSIDDLTALRALGQVSSWLLERGQLLKFSLLSRR